MNDYFERGWVILPILPGQKKAAHSWKSLQNDPDAPAKSRAFWEANTAPANAAVMTGKVSGVFVVDIDPGHLAEDAQAFRDKLLFHSPTDLIAETPRGGWHLYYHYPETHHIGQSRGALPVGVDVRGQGGYALVPPSEVEYPDGFRGSYRWLRAGQPGEASKVLLNLITTRPAPGPDDDADEVEDKLARIMKGQFTPGAHNDELFWAASYMRRKGLPETAIISMLVDADSRDASPQGSEQVRATCRSVFAYANDKDALLGAPEDIQKILAEYSGAEKTVPGGKPAAGSPALLEMSRYIGEYAAETRFLVDKYLPMGAALLMTAAAETGKTWLLMDMAVTIALGSKFDPQGFLGQHPSYYPEGRNVILFQQEDQPGKISQRIEAIYSAHIRRLGNPFRVRVEPDGVFNMPSVWDLPGQIYIYPTADFSFEKEGAFEALEAMVEEHKAAAVFFDPLYTLGSGENYFSEFKDHFQRLKHIRIRHNVTFMIAHHMRKSQDGSARANAYGSVLLDAASEGQLILFADRTAGEKHPTLTIRGSGKAFNATFTEAGRLIINTEQGQETLDFEPVREDMEVFMNIGKHAYEVYRLLLDSAEEMTEAAIAKTLSLHNSSVGRVLNGLLDEGYVKCTTPDISRNRKWIAVAEDTEVF